MKKRVLPILLLFCIILSNFCVYAENGGADAKAQYEVFVDSYENTAKMKSFSEGIKAMELDPKKFYGYKNGLQFVGLSKGAEIVYEVPFEIGSYTLTLTGDIAEYSPDFTLFLSVDGVNYNEDKYAEHRKLSGYRVYTNPEVLKENRFIKIVYNSKTAPGNLYLLEMEINEEPFIKVGGERIRRTLPPTFDYSTLPSLKEAYKDYFPIGAASEPFDLATTPELLESQFSAMVSENQSHFHGLEPREGVFNFTTADQIFNYGVENDMVVRLHALWFYPGTPAWVFTQPGGGPVSEDVFRKGFERYIKTVVSHYKGKVKYYDVVNELFETDFKRFLPEYKVFNDDEKFLDFIADIFKWAHEADPDAKLIFLDNRLVDQDKRDLIWHNIIPRVLERGVPKDVFLLGEQGHWGVNTIVYKKDEIIEGSSIESMLDEARALGINIAITELDLALSSAAVASDMNGETSSLTREQKHELLAKKWASIFDLFRDNADIIEMVTFWCVSDNTSWKTKTTEDCVLLFDFNFEPYPAFYRMFDFEKKEPRWTTDDIVEIAYANNYTPREIQAVYGTPVVDGKKDAVWDKTEVLEIDRQISGKTGAGATGNVRCLWDEDNFYVFVEVKDDILCSDNQYDWFKDNVEIFVSEKNQKGASYIEGDCQLRITWDGILSGWGGGAWAMDWFDAARNVTDDGYTAEFVYHMHKKENKTDDVLGFEALITVMVDGTDQRRSVRKFCDNVNESSITPTLWGTARLVNKVQKESAVQSDGDVQKEITVDGLAYTLNCVSEDGTDYVSARNLASALGGTVRYHMSNDEIILILFNTEFIFRAGQTTVFVNGKKTDMLKTVEIKDKKIMLPLDFVLMNMGRNYSL